MYIRLSWAHFHKKQHVLCHKLVIKSDYGLEAHLNELTKSTAFGWRRTRS